MTIDNGGSERSVGRVRRGGPLALVVVVALVMVLSSCSATSNDSRSATAGMPNILQDLAARTWILDPADSSLGTMAGSPVTLGFRTNHQLSGSAPCNTYRASFTLDDGSIDIGPVASTQMACGDDAMAAEHRYLGALEKVHDVDVTKLNRLVLTGSSAVRLSYRSQDVKAAVVGDWKVIQLATGNAVEGTLPGTDVVVTFHPGGALAADAGCNPIASSWKLDGSRLTVDPPRQGLKSCDSPAGVMDQEAALTHALTSASRVSVVGDTLTIYNSDDHILLTATKAPAH